MTEYANSPSAIEEWNNARSRTADWVHKFSVPNLPPTPTSSGTDSNSDWEKRSLWDGNGWEPPSDCESSTSVPPTMMLQYPDKRQVVITPHADEGDSAAPRSRSRGRRAHGSNHGDRHTHRRGETRRDEERTEHALSVRTAERAPGTTASASAPKSEHETPGVHPSQTSSARLARAAAAPLPDSRSSSSATGSRSRSGSGNGGSGFGRIQSATRSVNEASLEVNTPSTRSRTRSKLSRVDEVEVDGSGTPVPGQRVPTAGNAHAPSHPPTHTPTHVPSRLPSQHPSHVPSHPPSQHPSRVPSHVPTQQPSRNPSHVPSHQPSHAPSIHPQPNHPPSAFSNHATVTAVPASAAPSVNGIPGAIDGAPASVNGVPPSVNGGGIPAPSPPSIHSIHSRSISVSDSRSSGPPEQIVVHPPSSQHSTSGHGPGISPSNSHSLSHSHSQAHGYSPGMYPRSVTLQSVPPSINGAANVPLPPSSAASASLSYYSVQPGQSRVGSGVQGLQERQSIAPSHHTQVQIQPPQQQQQHHASPNVQLLTPISPLSPTGHRDPYASMMPMRASSAATMSTTGLGGGYVLVDTPSPGYEKEMERDLAENTKKGSSGRKSMRERGSLFNVFGAGKQSGHSKSRSLPMNGMGTGPGVEAQNDSTYHRSPTHNPNPDLTPISPTSPQFPVDPLSGPHPPPIVYAPARHHRATHYEPPRIVYRQRNAPYDTQQILHAYTYGEGYSNPNLHPYASSNAYQQYPHGTPVGAYGQYANGAGMPGPSYKTEHSPGSVRRSKTLQDPVRDSGWEEVKRGRETSRGSSGSAVRSRAEHDRVRSVNVGGVIARDYAFENGNAPAPSLTSPQASGEAHLNATPAAVSPSRSHATVPVSASASVSGSVDKAARAPSVRSGSTATSAGTNLAGVGTVSGRSRSRGRAQNDLPLDEIAENDHENGTERGRSRSRVRSGPGMVYSASAPQPQGSVAPPHAAMMIPPPSTVRDRGVRDTPYPTPPGSVSDQLHLQHHGVSRPQSYLNEVVPNGYAPGHNSADNPTSPLAHSNEASPTPAGLVSRFRDIYHSPISPRGGADRDSSSMSPSRGRTRERSKKGGGWHPQHLRDLHLRGMNGMNGNGSVSGSGRAKSVDSQASCSSSSTYYVLTSPGQKVRVVRTDGLATTESTSVPSRNPSTGGWLRKAAALRPRFLHRDAAPEHSPTADRSKHRGQDHPHSPARTQAPALDPARPPSGGSGKSGKSRKKGGRKLVRKNSTSSTALLNSLSQKPSQGATLAADEDRDVDIVIPGQ